MEKRANEVPFALGFLQRITTAAFGNSEPQNKQLWLNVHDRVAKSLISAMDVPAIRAPGPPKPVHTQIPLTSVRSDWLAQFYLDRLLLEPDDNGGSTAHEMCSKIAAQAHLISTQEFSFFWFPFLQHLIFLLQKRTSNPLSNHHYQHLFTALLDAYLAVCVGPMPEAAQLTTLRRPRVPCPCDDCGRLNAFLYNSSQGIGRFAFGAHRRKHLEDKLRSAGIDCKCETDTRGSPHTLVVNKTNKQALAASRQWTEAKATAEATLEQFPREALATLLGDEFVRIVGVEGIKPRGVPVQPQPLRPFTLPGVADRGQTAVAAAAGVKRKAEMIDLGGGGLWISNSV